MLEAESSPARPWLDAVFGNSPYLTLAALREPDFVISLIEHGPDATLADLLGMLNPEPPERSLSGLMSRLRTAKRRVALLVGMADIAALWPLARVTSALSIFAEQALRITLAHLLHAAATAGQIELAQPDDPERASGIFVLAMGKLGALELNYSSDIDLMVLFDPAMIRYRGRDSVNEFAVRLTRQLVKVLEERTTEGYVFRTDLRLRPDPRSTPLAVTVEAAESYYGSIGQNWERAALIKARAVAGDIALGERFLAELQPFIWRKHLDFAAIRDIQSIKRQIDARHGAVPPDLLGHNIKLGHGGIREIELFAQTQQLIWGGRQPHLRKRSTVEALNALVTADRIEPAVATELILAYETLRRIEHRLQMIADQQTHSLPSDPAAFERLAIFLGFDDSATFATALRATLVTVQQRFAALFPGEPSLATEGNLVFTGADDDPETTATLSSLGFADPHRVAEVIRGWHHGQIRATRSARARELLTELMPTLLATLGKTADPDVAFARFGEFLANLPAGVQILTLLQHRPQLLELLAEIMGESPLLAGHLARRPILLDGVLTGDFFTPLADDGAAALQSLHADLRITLEAARHYEEQLESLRRWAADRRFQIAIQLLRSKLDGERAGRDFTLVAEAAIASLLPLVETEFRRQHGKVDGGAFAVLGLGKLGSREMNLLSDLDLTFIYDFSATTDMDQNSDGPKPLPAGKYFARLSQRVIEALSAPMADGSLYDVDMRLRPSGAGGPIASSLDSFSRYHDEQAWTWERMALTRGRVIAGDPPLITRITRRIGEILQRPADPALLLADVADMRQRIAETHSSPQPWDCKHRRGALIDLEFVAQYLQLCHAHTTPHVLHWNTAAAFGRLAEAGYLSGSELAAARGTLILWHCCQQNLRALLGKSETKPIADRLGQRALDRALQPSARTTSLEILDHASAAGRALYERFIAPIAPPDASRSDAGLTRSSA